MNGPNDQSRSSPLGKQFGKHRAHSRMIRFRVLRVRPRWDCPRFRSLEAGRRASPHLAVGGGCQDRGQLVVTVE